MSLRTLRGSVLVLLVLVVALAVVACMNAQGGDEIVVTDEDSGSAVTLDAGQTLVIRLESNPSTGYSWEAIEVPGMLEGDFTPVHEVAEDSEDLVGTAGLDVFTMTAAEQGEGEGTVVIVYRRPWETDVAPEKEFTLDVTVR